MAEGLNSETFRLQWASVLTGLTGCARVILSIAALLPVFDWADGSEEPVNGNLQSVAGCLYTAVSVEVSMVLKECHPKSAAHQTSVFPVAHETALGIPVETLHQS